MGLNPAWAAGFFDGEGCITITKQPTVGRNPTYHPVANLVNSHKRSLMLFKREYGGNIYTHQKKAKHHLGRYWACKVDVWLWCCPVNALPRLLRDMLPYLTVKARQARVLLSIAHKGEVAEAVFYGFLAFMLVMAISTVFLFGVTARTIVACLAGAVGLCGLVRIVTTEVGKTVMKCKNCGHPMTWASDSSAIHWIHATFHMRVCGARRYLLFSCTCDKPEPEMESEGS